MSRPSPASATKHEDVDSSESSQAVGWDMAGPSLQLQDAVVETITTHVVRKTTSFRPITLPHIPPPTRLDLPRHLPAERYPLASAPNLFTGAITASVGGQILSFTERSAPSSRPALRPGQTWARVSSTAPSKAAIEASILNSHDTAEPSPRHHLTPPRTEGKSRSRAESINGSPPRKRTRTATRGTQGPLPSPMPSPQRDGPPSISTAGPSTQSTSSARNTGTGLDVAALLSLPAIMEHFDQLHDKAKLHVLEYMLRRSNRSVIQQVAAFAGSGLHRDMIADLPQEVAVQVFKSLDTRSLGRAAQVSKTWARLIDNERGIWLQRLVQEDLYLGHGIEENDEKVLARRMRLIDEYNKPTSRLEWPVALKHVFRRRFCSARNWLHKKPVHTSCPAVGSPGSIVTGTQFANGKIITARDRKVMHVYDVKTGQLLTRLRGHTEGIWAMDAYGNTLATGATDRTLRVWNVNTGRAHIFQGHISTIRCLKIVQPVWYENEQCFFPPCPLVVSGSRDGTLRVWRIPEEGEPYHNDFVSKVAVGVPPERNPYFLHMAVGHTDAIRAMAVHGRTVITASYDRSVRVWDVIDGSAKKVLMGHTDKVYSVVYDKYRNRCASGSVDNTVRIWDVGTGECLHLLDGHIALVGMLESSANRLLLAASDTSLCLLDAERYQKSSRVNTQGSAISAFTHDHIKTVYAADGALRLFDTRAGKHVRTLTTGVTAAWQCVIKDNYLIVSSNRNSAKVYDIFDFGKLDHPSGIDDESIDDIEGPEWKRLLPQTLDRKWYPQPSTHVKGKGKARVVSRYRHDLYDDDGGTSDAVPVSNDPTSEESDEGDEDSEDGVLFDNTVEHDVDDHEDERLYQLDDDYEMDAEEQPQPPSTHISASDGINDQMVEESEEEAEEDVEEGTGGVVYEAGESDDDTEGEDEYEQSAIDASTIDPAPPADWMGNLSESGARFIPWPQFDDYRAEEAHAGPSTAPLAPAADRNTLIRTAANPTLQQRLEQRANAAILNASSSPMLDAPGSSRSTTRARTQLVAVHQADNTAHQAQLVQGGSSTGVHDTDAVLAAVAMPGLAAGGGARSSPRFPTRSPIAHATSAERETGYYTADVPVFGNRSNKRAGATDGGSPLPRSAPRLGAGLVSGSREMMIPSSAGGSVAGPSGTHGSGASAQDIMSSEQIGDNWFEEE